MSESNAASESAHEGISPEDQARIDKIKRRNLIFGVIAGIVMLILGFLTGQHAQEKRSDSLEQKPAAVVLEMMNLPAGLEEVTIL